MSVPPVGGDGHIISLGVFHADEARWGHVASRDRVTQIAPAGTEGPGGVYKYGVAVMVSGRHFRRLLCIESRLLGHR